MCVGGFEVRVKGIPGRALSEGYVRCCQRSCVLEWGLQGTTSGILLSDAHKALGDPLWGQPSYKPFLGPSS